MLDFPARSFVIVLISMTAACSEKDKAIVQDPAAMVPDPMQQAPGAAPGSPNTGTNKRIPDPCVAAEKAARELELLKLRYTDNHPEVIHQKKFFEAAEAQCSGPTVNESLSGNWIVEDGVRVCDGYLVRNADQDYCAAEVPDDWVPREFDGQKYYVQPLKGIEQESESHRG